jgi:hypothetical protein
LNEFETDQRVDLDIQKAKRTKDPNDSWSKLSLAAWPEVMLHLPSWPMLACNVLVNEYFIAQICDLLRLITYKDNARD